MGSKTGIEWTDATWNPIIGCSRVSEGCRHCYAETIAGRFSGGKPTVYSGLTQIANGHPQWTGKIVETKQLLQPLSWRKPKRVFVNSMSDLFHENVTDEQRDRIFAVMALTPQHTFQVLTKRPERMLAYFADLAARTEAIQHWITEIMLGAISDRLHARTIAALPNGWGGLPLKHVWLGVSTENQATADERIPLLLQTPAAVRFISAEPLLGPVDLSILPRPIDFHRSPYGWHQWWPKKLRWVIVGGESGSGARPMHPDWARSLRDQCQAAGVPFFFKQWGKWCNGSEFRDDAEIVLNDGRHVLSIAEVAQEDRNRWNEFEPCMMARVGKKSAGALLDGRKWKQFPEVHHAE